MVGNPGPGKTTIRPSLMPFSSPSQPVPPHPDPLPSRGEGIKGMETAPFRILRKFAYLLSARWVREALQAAFLIYLARISATTYGEFMLAIGLGSILLLVAEFGLNLPLVSLLSQKDGDRNAALSQVVVLKAGLLVLALLGVLGFMAWQDYCPAPQAGNVHAVRRDRAGGPVQHFFCDLAGPGPPGPPGQDHGAGGGLGFGYGLIALALGAPPLFVAAFKLIESLVNLGGSFILVRAQGGLRLKLPSWARLGSTLRLGLVFALIEVSAILYNKANLFFLQKYAGPHGVAQYSVTWQTVDGISGAGLRSASAKYPVPALCPALGIGPRPNLPTGPKHRPLAPGRRPGGHVRAVHRKRPHYHLGLRPQLRGSHLAAKDPGGDRGLCLFP